MVTTSARRRRRRTSEPQYELGRAAIYSRISNPGDTREASLETQEQAIIIRLRELGYECDEGDIFRDQFTGKETLRRKRLNDMRELVRQGVYKAVGVYKLDRLARNMGHSFVLLGEMDELSVRPVSVCEQNIDDSPQGKMYRMMGSYMAEAELANLEDRFGRGREFIQDKGLPLGRGVPPYGYTFHKKEGRVFMTDEDGDDHDGTAKWARLIFHLMADGKSGHEVASHLNALKVPPPGLARGFKYRKKEHTGLWNANVIRNIIKNPAYKGWAVEGKYFSEGVTDAGHSVMKAIPQDEWMVFDTDGRIMPVMVPSAVWDKANATRQANANNVNSAGRKKNNAVLRGMIYCHLCGEKLYSSVNQHGNTMYRCANHTLIVQKRRAEAQRCRGKHVRGAWIEPLVWEQFRDLILTPGRLEAAVLKMLADAPADHSTGELEIAKANLAEQERIRAKFFRKWREEEARPDPDPDLSVKWEADYRNMRGPIESLKRTVESLSRQVAAQVDPASVAREVAERFHTLRERILVHDDTTPDERREALLAAKTKVIVTGNGRRSQSDGGTGEIHFYLFDQGDEPARSPARSFRLFSLRITIPNLSLSRC